MMITALLIPAVVAGFLVQVDDEAVALAKARAFRDVAATANRTYSNLYSPVFELRGTDHSSDKYVFEFKDGGVILLRSNHLVVGFSFSPLDEAIPLETWDSLNAIGDSAAVALAMNYLTAAGHSLNFVVMRLRRENNVSGRPGYVFNCAPTYNGIPFDGGYQAFAVIEPSTGRLTGYFGPENTPNPPASLQSSISPETALYNFASWVYSNYGASNLNIDGAELVIWNPKPQDINQSANNVPQAVLDLIGTNESTLVYYFSAFQPSMGESTKTDVAFFEGYVDPNSGTVWSVKQYTPFGGGGGKLAPLRWDLGLGEIIASNGRHSIEVKDADVDRVPAPKAFNASSRLVLRRAKVVVMIEYDRTSGLLRTTLREAHSYGKPSPNLKKALDRLTG